MKDYFLAMISPRAIMNTIRTGCKPHDFTPRYDIMAYISAGTPGMSH